YELVIFGGYWFGRQLQRNRGSGRSSVMMNWENNCGNHCNDTLIAVGDLLQQKYDRCSGQRELESGFKWKLQ
ncbi:hypothetical protein HAX54_041150, partial [Datura stramonium]|nr:hypothetical protein [Datura stramonium]